MKAKRFGVAGVRPTEPTGALYLEAQRILKAKAEKAAARKAARDSRPVPNYICYAWLFPNYDPKTGKGAPQPLPRCKKCDGVIHPQEHHLCEGFVPKYVEHTPERKERWEAQREEIRETRRLGRGVFCTECGDLLEDPEDAQWHAEDHGGKAQRNHYAVDGEPDGDLDGYDDEPEDDYCDDDDGYDCD